MNIIATWVIIIVGIILGGWFFKEWNDCESRGGQFMKPIFGFYTCVETKEGK